MLLDIAAVLILLCAFACLGSKLFDRYVIYYGAQSIVLSFAAAVVALHQHDAGLWVLAALTFAIKGIGIPYGTRHFLIDRFELKRDVVALHGPVQLADLRRVPDRVRVPGDPPRHRFRTGS